MVGGWGGDGWEVGAEEFGARPDSTVDLGTYLSQAL